MHGRNFFLVFWLFIPYVLQSLKRQKDGILKVLYSVILKVFFSLNNFVILKLMLVADVLEERARPWWFFSCNFSYYMLCPIKTKSGCP